MFIQYDYNRRAERERERELFIMYIIKSWLFAVRMRVFICELVRRKHTTTFLLNEKIFCLC